MLTSKNLVDLGNLEGLVLLYGGPYSNLQATTALREVATELNIPSNNIICTGDTVAYCGQPEETVNLIRHWGCHVVMGNCEESVGNEFDDCGCGFEEGSICATLSIGWYQHAVSAVSAENKRWMSTLPTRIDFQMQGLRYAVIHGSPENLSEFIFESESSDAKRVFLQNLGVDCIIGGHCGLPFAAELSDGWWINPGVIGMPANDGTPNGWYALLQVNNGSVNASWHRLNYDYAGAMEAMSASKLGDAYQKSLASGLWPSTSVLPKREESRQGHAIKINQIALSKKRKAA